MEHAEQIVQELKNIELNLKTTLATQNEEIRKSGETSSKTGLELKALEGKYDAAMVSLEEVKAQFSALEAKNGRLGADKEERLLTPGQAFQAALEAKSNGEGQPRGWKQGERSTLAAEFESKALSSSAASAGAWIQTQRIPLFEIPLEPHIRDLFAQGQTVSNSLTFPVRKTWTNAAAMVAELAVKPESNLVFEDKTFPVRKIAHFVKLSDELMQDAPAIQAFIDAQLIEGLKDVEDMQLLKGDGTGQNLQGVYTAATVYNRTTAADTLVDVLRRAITQLRIAKYSTTGIVLSPSDWEKIELLKGTDNKYIWTTIPDAGGERLWRAPVRDTLALAAGEWLVGNFRRGAQIFDRQQAQVIFSNVDANDFTMNRVTALAEERLSLVIYDTTAFVKNAP